MGDTVTVIVSLRGTENEYECSRHDSRPFEDVVAKLYCTDNRLIVQATHFFLNSQEVDLSTPFNELGWGASDQVICKADYQCWVRMPRSCQVDRVLILTPARRADAARVRHRWQHRPGCR
jgi:hypothetical protein